MLELLKNKRILVVVAHPDDELLGLGGTINKLSSEYNATTRAIILGEGITSRADGRNPEMWKKELDTHSQNMLLAAKAVGYDSIKGYDFPDNRFDSVDLLDIVKVIEKDKEDFRPDVIFTHHGGDTNIDHRVTFDAVMPAIRPMQGEIVKIVLTFETPSSTEWQAPNYPNYFRPNVFIELSEANVEAKVKGMEHYEFESRKYPHPRSPEALRIISKRWGVNVGYDYAEPFMLIRSI
ncbi:PIG-L deacetylase family protein [Aequorivita viscosa]|uniref:N-acetylglucosaminyl deacetylase, LmbE family n=1 Tax=Aequorivita viscosa TaxID=797419 RepID=A0A1M6FP85_9FLAO|nr:PIG-L deacetylase family protein [Aequorivita viscosa]SDW74844.1 N-acetylglucosaminyl deacetylase, LmbE family [Aequorivita viscosa]SHI99492.1 N-acetylglucosaminyl deacetylase, LmbE family [Aequorivita viscosa]